jgi:hypothetical protein
MEAALILLASCSMASASPCQLVADRYLQWGHIVSCHVHGRTVSVTTERDGLHRITTVTFRRDGMPTNVRAGPMKK